MGLFDRIFKIIGSLEKVENIVENNMDKIQEIANANKKNNSIVLAETSHVVEETEYGNDDSEYIITFEVNDAFREAKSHAMEVSMLSTYSPDDEYGEEGKIPYVAIQCDDDVYTPVEQFKDAGTFDGAIELTPLEGTFYFKAKKEYYGNMMYFYGLDRLDGFWENNALCMVYPMEYVGTESEAKLMRVLDEAAASYCEKKVE